MLQLSPIFFLQRQTDKIYVKHTIFKDEEALGMRPKLPDYITLKMGGVTLAKEGCMFLEFTPAVGPCQYDWSKRKVISLSRCEEEESWPPHMVQGSSSPTSTSWTYKESASGCFHAFRMRPTRISNASNASLETSVVASSVTDGFQAVVMLSFALREGE